MDANLSQSDAEKHIEEVKSVPRINLLDVASMALVIQKMVVMQQEAVERAERAEAQLAELQKSS